MTDLRTMLEDRRHDLLKRKSAMVAELIDDVPDRVGDSIDVSTEEQTGATQLELETRLARELAEIDAALGRINEGSFGECEDCGDPIGERRLAARPLARLCVDCQEEVESETKKRYKRPGLMDEFE